jgi:hypothetical protein
MSSVTRSSSESVADLALPGLCVFSVANPLIAQAAPFIFPYDIAGMNIMQWFQGLCLPLILLTLPKLPRGGIAFSRLLWAFIILLGFFHFRALFSNRLPADVVNTERMVYFKIVFALLLWYYASRLVRSYESARKLLQWILLGAFASAAWIFICYFSGIGAANYASAGVKATSGSEGVSGKAMAGFLLLAAGGAVFLTLREDSHRWALCAAVIAAAVFVTFDRSAQAALLVGAGWMAIWWFAFACPRPRSRSIVLFLCIMLALGGIYFVHKGMDELMTRWTQDLDRGEVGSGRGVFYATAWDWFWSRSSTTDFLLGMGYGNIYGLMYSASGLQVHTHSDFFDMLLAGGIVGVLLYLLMLYTVASLGKGLSSGSLGFAMLGALLLSFGVMSLLTGLMAFPHTLYALGAECICIRALVCEEEGDLIPSIEETVHRVQWDFAPAPMEALSPSKEDAERPGTRFNSY